MFSRPRIALLGRFDVARFGELLLPRIHEAELRRRLPGSRVLPYAPLGPEHPVALDGGLTTLPLGTWSPDNSARLAAADAVIVAGAGVLATDDQALGADYGLSAADAHRRHLSGFFLEGPQPKAPMAWSAVGVPSDFGEADASRVRRALQDARYVSVRDEVSRRRLLKAGAERDITVVPDPVALAFRVFEPAVLARRLDYLRLMEWFPREGAPVVVQGSEALFGHAESIAAALTDAVAGRNVPILLLETEPAEGDLFVEALMPRLRGAIRVPASVSLVDILAVFSGARCFVGDSVHGNMAALGFGVPSLFVSPGAVAPALATLGDAAPAGANPADAGNVLPRLLAQARTDGLPSHVAIRLEAHFDALASFADRALAESLAGDGKTRSREGTALLRALQDAELRLDATRDAWEARSEQIAALRIELAEQLESLESGFASQADRALLAERDAQLARRLGELEAMRAEFLRFTNLRVFTYTAPLRRLYASLRRALGRTGG